MCDSHFCAHFVKEKKTELKLFLQFFLRNGFSVWYKSHLKREEKKQTSNLTKDITIIQSFAIQQLNKKNIWLVDLFLVADIYCLLHHQNLSNTGWKTLTSTYLTALHMHSSSITMSFMFFKPCLQWTFDLLQQVHRAGWSLHIKK